MATQAEIALVAELLERDWEGHSSAEVAKEIIDAMRSKERALFKKIGAAPPEIGTAFKTPFSDTTYIVAWAGTELPGDPPVMWVVSSDSHYGWMGTLNSPLMKIYKDAAIRQPTVDKILAPAVDLQVGDGLLFRQDLVFMVEAMFSRGALLRHEATGLLYQETNSALDSYYRKRVGR